jgi:hypothetical protein
MNSPMKHQTRPSDAQREDLQQIARDGRRPTRKARWAWLLYRITRMTIH